MSRSNVLLVVMDSVRARNVGHLGHERDTTPFLDAFADGATVHREARAPGRWSLPAHASLFTGRHVAEHRLFDEGRQLRPGNTIWADLSERGYETGVFSYNGYINGATESGLERDFDTVEGYRDPPFPEAANPQGIRGQHREFLRRCVDSGRPVRSALNGLLMKLAWDHPERVPERLRRETMAGETPDEVYVEEFLDWQRDREGPWAACLNLMITHNPFEPTPEHDRWGTDRAREIQDSLAFGNWEFLGGQEPLDDLAALEVLYDGTIREADAHVRRIVETLRERNDLEDTLVVVTGDHGEGFGGPDPIRPDLPTVQHVVGSHEHLLHVPLVVKYPGQTDRIEVDDPSSLTAFPRVARAVADGEDVVPGETFVPDDGRVLASTHGLNEVNWERMLEFCDGDTDRFDEETRVVYERDGDRTLKHLGWRDRAVTVAVEDPRTRRIVEGHDPATVVADAFDDLTDASVIDAAGAGIDAETERRLEALGYR